MKFKGIQTILTFISLQLMVSSSPIFESDKNSKSFSTEVVDDIIYIKDEISEEFSKITNSISGAFEKALKKDDDVCMTPECATTSSRILDNLDTEVDPCDDFYQFTCGNFIKKSVIPDDEVDVSQFSTIKDKNLNILRGILEGEYKGINNSTIEQQNSDKKIFLQLKNYYNSCMDEKNINSKGKKPLVDFLNQLEIYKNRESYKNPDGLATLNAKLLIYDVSFLFISYVSNNINDPDNKVIGITTPDIGLQVKEYYENEEIVSKYKGAIKEILTNILNDEEDGGNFFTRLFRRLFGGGNKRDFDKLSNSIVEFEKKLANIFTPPDKKNDFTLYKVTTIKTLNEKYPYLNWLLYFETLFDAYNMKDIINENTKIAEYGSYLEDLSNIIKETDVEILSTYAEWNIIFTYISSISEEFKKPITDLNALLYGINTKAPRSETCINRIQTFMGMAISRYYINEVFNEESREAAQETVKNIKEALEKRISEIKWLDESTRKSALEKLNTVVDKIGYPDLIMKPEMLEKEYERLEIVSDDFFTNMVQVNKNMVRNNLKETNKSRDKTKWDSLPVTIDAFYNAVDNSITFPAGILEPPLFNLTDPSYINYGGIGSIIGHELTHAFDNTGKEFDLNGKYFNWWTNSTEAEFDKLSQCFIDQYGNYTIEDNKGNKININGQLTLGENLADNGGLDRAYEAYQIYLKKNKDKGKNQSLPGLTKYTNDQLFFISFGQIWCSKRRPEIAAQLALTDPHSPPQYRVNGSLRNNKYFAKAFKCKTNSPMNPEKKCSVW
ncbi:Metalloproteases [Neocallimastix lanati (nom. inval.)]|jgi:predicted metalloendopeptidase|nr:Metalloproteases [Neocallimastix sp. JGI-2020a]